MRNIKRILIFMFLVINVLSQESIADDYIDIAIGEWRPFTSEKDENGKLAEIIADEALKLVGLKVRYAYYPWKRSYQLARIGEVHATLPWFRAKKREKEFIYCKEGLIEDSYVLFHLKGSEFHWESIEDLKKYRLGGTAGHFQMEYYHENGIEVNKVASELLNFKMILANRIDAYATSYYVGYNMIKEELGEDKVKLFSHSEKPIKKDYYYILVSRNIPKAQDLADRIDEGIRKLKSSGRYGEIVGEYFR